MILRTTDPAALTWAAEAIESARQSGERIAEIEHELNDYAGRTDLRVAFMSAFTCGATYDRDAGVPERFRVKTELKHTEAGLNVITPKLRSAAARRLHSELYGFYRFALWREIARLGVARAVDTFEGRRRGRGEIRVDSSEAPLAVYSIWETAREIDDIVADKDQFRKHGWEEIALSTWEEDTSHRFVDSGDTFSPPVR